MKLSNAIRKRIKDCLEEKNMNVWNLCKKTGIPWVNFLLTKFLMKSNKKIIKIRKWRKLQNNFNYFIDN